MRPADGTELWSSWNGDIPPEAKMIVSPQRVRSAIESIATYLETARRTAAIVSQDLQLKGEYLAAGALEVVAKAISAILESEEMALLRDALKVRAESR